MATPDAASLLHTPLPLGIEYSIRTSETKPQGYAQYMIVCPVHGEKRADRVKKVADILNTHRNCRWVLNPRLWHSELGTQMRLLA